MNDTTRPVDEETEQERTAEQVLAVKTASSWLNQFARTLKTCRLYDANNPTVIRFREDLGSALRKLLNEYQSVSYSFTSDDVLYDGESLYPARTRDDNFALPFYRDGIRSITLRSGIESRELENLITALLTVTGQNHGDDDLVTLLWEANLRHIDIDYVPSEGDMGGGGSAEGGELVPWPTAPAQEEETQGSDSGVDQTSAEEVGEEKQGRSDDWTVGDLTVEIEAGFEELDALSKSEVERFREEYRAEHAVPTVTATLAIANAFLRAGATDDDRSELAAFLPRVLRHAVSHGSWLEAREALSLLEECGAGAWNLSTFVQELMQPISISATVERIDQQEATFVVDMLGFARDLGDPAVEWLNLILAESQSRRNRRMVAEAIANLCRENPERLAPYLSDPRWYVVRNIVHILGWIGGNAIVGMLDSALRHSDVRVRQEAVAALGQVDIKLARPLLLRMLHGSDSKTFCTVLHQLSNAHDAQTARLLLALMQDPEFDERPANEQRAIYSALSATGGDEVLPELEADLHRTSWFSRTQEAHRQNIGRIIARIGTPLARMILDRGAQSRRGPVRKACQDALGGFAGRD